VSGERVHHLDWLKVLIVYGIVVFHVSLVFTYGSWLVNYPERSLALSAFAAFCFPWGIPAMFLIAGADAWFGLRSRTVAEFVRKRFLRLVVPLVPGLLILSPLQRFVVSHNPPPSLDRLPAYYLEFFRGMEHIQWSLGVIGQYWLHLWFLAYLFGISLACAPLIKWLHRSAGRLLTARIADEAHRRGLILFVLPLMLTQVVLRPLFPSYQDWADVMTYTIAFMWGAVVFAERRFETVITSQIRRILVVALIATVMLGAVMYLMPPHGAWREVLRALAWSLYVWTWLHAVLYLGIRWLNFPHPVITYARESVLPVYVIHHPFVLLIASFAVTWGAGTWPTFFVILVPVFAITVTIYEFGVRRWNATRVIFGLGPLPKKPRPAAPRTARQTA